MKVIQESLIVPFNFPIIKSFSEEKSHIHMISILDNTFNKIFDEDCN